MPGLVLSSGSSPVSPGWCVRRAVQYVAVGATMVASVNHTVSPGDTVRKGDELGYFAFGGSTVILVFEPNKIAWDADLETNSLKPLETLIRMGQRVATRVSGEAKPVTPGFRIPKPDSKSDTAVASSSAT